MNHWNRWMGLLGVLALLHGCGGGGSSSEPQDATPPTSGNGSPAAVTGSEYRETAYGQVVGSNDAARTGTYSWKGIPYAKPPVGALRWKAPVEPVAWKTPRQATKFGEACMQTGRIYGPGAHNRYDASIVDTLQTTVGSEDCLTLNIWRPAGDVADLPVIVFVHGGSNISGYSADPMYDGAALAKTANAVVVTLNYRLDVFGFLNLEQLKTGSDIATDSGNFALLDVMQALKFVKSNIAKFGGNAGNVTLVGQSAGAINVWALMTSPLATGLFHRVAPLSGGIALLWNLPPGSIPTLNPAVNYRKQADSLLDQLLVDDGKAANAVLARAYAVTRTKAQIADYLRGKDGNTILQAVLRGGLTGSGPIPDGNVIPLDPIRAITAGNYNRMPAMVGYTADEGKSFAKYFTYLGGPPGLKINDAELFRMVANFDPDAPPSRTVADIIDPAYLPVEKPYTGFNAKADTVNRLIVYPNRDAILNALLSQQSDVWTYQFRWAQEPAPWNDVAGAAHGFDLLFLFRNFGPSLFTRAVASKANEPGRLGLSSAMMARLAAFARSGNPNNAQLGTTWQPWPQILLFDASPSQALISVK